MTYKLPVQEKPSERTFNTTKDEFLNCFLFFWAISTLLDPDPDTNLETPLNPDPMRIQIRIQNTAYNNPES